MQSVLAWPSTTQATAKSASNIAPSLRVPELQIAAIKPSHRAQRRPHALAPCRCKVKSALPVRLCCKAAMTGTNVCGYMTVPSCCWQAQVCKQRIARIVPSCACHRARRVAASRAAVQTGHAGAVREALVKAKAVVDVVDVAAGDAKVAFDLGWREGEGVGNEVGCARCKLVCKAQQVLHKPALFCLP